MKPLNMQIILFVINNSQNHHSGDEGWLNFGSSQIFHHYYILDYIYVLLFYQTVWSILFPIYNTFSFLFGLLIYYFSYFLILCFIIRKWYIRQQLSNLRWMMVKLKHFSSTLWIDSIVQDNWFLILKASTFTLQSAFSAQFSSTKVAWIGGTFF